MKSKNKISSFVALVGIQVGFIFANMFWFLYIKEKLKAYINTTQLVVPALQGITPGQAPSAEQVALIQQLNSSSSMLTFFLFIVVPLVLIVLWILFQGSLWILIKKQKITWHNLYQNTIGTVIIGSLYLILIYFLTERAMSASIDMILFVFVGITGIAYYCLTRYMISEGKTLKEKTINALKKDHNRSLKKIGTWTLMFATSIILFFATMIAFISSFINNYFVLSKPAMIMTLVILCIGSIATKKMLYAQYKKVQGQGFEPW